MKKENQKAKLLYLYDYLMENTDEEHTVTVSDMIKHLAGCGISAERKSIYSDLETLENFGADIIKVKSKSTGYFIGQRKFEQAELLLLADAVKSSRFITRKKSEELIKKLQSLTSRNKGKSLLRKMLISNRVKYMNESIYYNIDIISEAIEEKKNIEFRYFSWNADKKQEYRHDGKKYRLIPYDLIWSEENLYLIGLDEDENVKKHFRVDKMAKITVGEKTLPKEKIPASSDEEEYRGKVFGMFGGKNENVTIRCDSSLAGVFIDKFGQDIVFFKTENGFETTVNVEVSPVFLSWVASFGDRAKIISPENVISDYKKLLKSSLDLY